MEWTPDRDDQLRVWRAEGFSYELIARKFSETKFLKSKNSVIGRALRLGLVNRVKKKPRFQIDNHAKFYNLIASGADLVAKIRRARPADVRKPTNDASAGEFLSLHLLELDLDQCRYPQGDGPIFFCGQPSMPGSSYCPTHHRICNIKARP